ncbi:helix-turn-helix domain-containing protein [Niallia sp. 03190]|uniref:helix-turn-helix domain-containing protein n=1 Tax=Niallia sp. 03190 TaxID=3458061 RepID=UPI0040443BB9
MNEYKTIIGNRLYHLRKQHKLPVEKIITRLGVARSTYTNWEGGYRAPNGKNLVILAEIFNTSVDFITGKTDEENLIEEVTEAIKNGNYVHNGRPLTESEAEQVAEMIKLFLNRS